MTVNHAVVFRWKDHLTNSDLERLGSELDRLPALVPGIESFTHGPDLGVREGNADYAVVATLRSVEALADYFDHPEHVRIINDVVAPMLESKQAVQFETP